MKTPLSSPSITCLALAALLFSLAGVATARETQPLGPSGGEARLPEGEILAADGDLIENSDSSVAPDQVAETVIASALLAERGSWRSMTVEQAYAQQGDDPQGSPKKGGFKRWMRKYWWIPAIVVGGVLGAELSDDDKGMDDPD